ncbi:hypothetical protein PM082_006862 [Marasmius tenuissimus]|nr:hypothetical protein PM082_006862 [Marasmius tenuissimus]
MPRGPGGCNDAIEDEMDWIWPKHKYTSQEFGFFVTSKTEHSARCIENRLNVPDASTNPLVTPRHLSNTPLSTKKL